MRAISLATALVVLAPTFAATAPSSAVSNDSLSGIWIGSFDATIDGAKRAYPVLFNLGSTDGLALLPDDLTAPSTFAFERVQMIEVKGKKITVEVIRGEGELAEILTFKVRSKRGDLKGKVQASNKDIKGGRTTLTRLIAEEPLQHLWTGTIAGARGADQPVALLMQSGKRKPTGVGFIGARFGPLADLVFDGTRATGTLRSGSADMAFDLELNGRGHLVGTIGDTAAARVSATLLPGHTEAPPRISKITPEELAVGGFTEVTITGKDLAQGFLLQSDHPNASATRPQIDTSKKATARVFVTADTPEGTEINLSAASADGSVAADVARLMTGDMAPASFSADLEPIFASTCALAGCHAQPELGNPLYPNGEAAADLVLENPFAYANLIDQSSTLAPSFRRVVPGDPEASYLIKKLRGDADLVGNRMPAGGPFLPDDVIAVFIRWVEEGAERN